MNSQKFFFVSLIFSLVTILLTACGSTTNEPTAVPEAQEEAAAPVVAEAPTEEPMTAASLSGTITVLTNRTDLVDTTFVEYAKQFNEIYPDVKVEFEAMRDYVGEVQIRMNTKDYGDVLLIPDNLPTDQLPDFFEPLGTVADLDTKYNFITEKAVGGQVYGIAVTGNAQGIACNQTVLDAAGITAYPTTPEAFIEDMKLVKENTDAIPVYTNYFAGWPLTQWESHRGTVTGDADYSNKMIHMDDPFSPGRAHYIIYKLMYDLVAQGLTEEDPTTTDWESSKQLIADGDIACMFLGSWSVVQFQELAQNPDDIVYIPFPANVDGQQYAAAGGDYKIAVNKNSENKEAALAWLWWFLNDSNFAFDQGGIPPLKGSDLPPVLSAFQKANVIFVAQNPATEGEEGVLDNIDNEAEIGLWTDLWKQRIVDAARGASGETLDDIFADLNQRWADARVELGIQP